MSNNSYVSVLSTESYLIAIKCLYKSLKNTKTEYPFTVIINDNISKETEQELIHIGINVIRKKSVNISDKIINNNNNNNAQYWNNTFDKLHIFELTEFSKIVYLDADMYIRKNIDELFDKPNMSAVIDKRYIPLISKDWIKLNSGLMVITPDNRANKEFEKILESISNNPKTCGDQDILQEYAEEWNTDEQLHLDDKYNVFFPFLDYYTHYTNMKLSDISIIHFVFDEKPWNYNGENKVSNYLKSVNNNLEDTARKRNLEILNDCVNIGNRDREQILNEYYKITE